MSSNPDRPVAATRKQPGAVRRPSVRRGPGGGPSWRRPGLWWLAALLLVVAAGTWWLNGKLSEPAGLGNLGEISDSLVVEPPKAGDRAVVVVFPGWSAAGYVSEDRRILSRGLPGEDLLGLLEALCDGPTVSGAVSALPRGTRALAAFVDPDGASAVVDFSQELVLGHPGGSAAEAATLTSILRTVALNFPRVRTCTILVDGRQVETLAGNLDMMSPFNPQRWL